MKYLINTPSEQCIQDMAVHDRPRERMVSGETESLSDLELLAIFIVRGSKERPVNTIAKQLLEVLDKKAIIEHQDLLNIPGLGMAKTTLICALWNWVEEGSLPEIVYVCETYLLV